MSESSSQNRSRLSRRSRRKGKSGEREIVRLHEEHGIRARRQPLSGALIGADLQGDVMVARRFKIEAKRTANGYRMLYRMLGHASMAWVRADNLQWLVIMPIDIYWLLAEDELKRLSEEPTIDG